MSFQISLQLQLLASIAMNRFMIDEVVAGVCLHKNIQILNLRTLHSNRACKRVVKLNFSYVQSIKHLLIVVK
mgnify:FL=1